MTHATKRIKKSALPFVKQLKNATERLDQEGITMRTALEEINRTLSIKVLLISSNMQTADLSSAGLCIVCRPILVINIIDHHEHKKIK